MAGLVLFAFWVRLQYWTIHGGTEDYFAWNKKHYFSGCVGAYLQVANKISQGQPYDYLGYPPGYPLFLCMLKMVGIESLQHQRLAQAMLDSCGVLAVFYLLRWLLVARHLALLGGVLYAVIPQWAAGCTTLLGESLTPTLVLWFLVLLVECSRRQRPWLWLLPGLLYSFASLVRPDLLWLLAPALAFVSLTTAAPLRRRAQVALLVGALPLIGAWTVHNKVRHDAWVFSSTSGGNTLWEGLGDMPNPHGYICSDEVAGDLLRAKGMKWHSVEAHQYFLKKYLHACRKRPGYFFEVAWYRWKQILFVVDRWSPYVFQSLEEKARIYGYLLVLAGLWYFRNDAGRAFLVALPLGYALLSIGLVHYDARYVRYAHLSYLFASMVLLSEFWQQVWTWNRHLARVAALVGWGMLLNAMGPELHRLHTTSRNTNPSGGLAAFAIDGAAVAIREPLVQATNWTAIPFCNPSVPD